MDQKNDKTDTRPVAADEESFTDQLLMMWRAFMASPVRAAIIAIGAGLLIVILTTAFGQIILNRWNQPFYDALQRRDLQAFFHQLVVFVQIASGILLLNVAQTWLNQMLRLKLREGLTRDLIGEWMRPRRAFRLANAGAIGVNPDQRVHEDAFHLTELSTDLGVGLLQATVLLASFVGVLWSLSIEEVFYIGLPLLCFTVRREWLLAPILLMLAISLPWTRAALVGNEIWRESAYLPGMAAIATGVLAALLVARVEPPSRGWTRVLAIVGTLGLGAVALGQRRRGRVVVDANPLERVPERALHALASRVREGPAASERGRGRLGHGASLRRPRRRLLPQRRRRFASRGKGVLHFPRNNGEEN